MECSKPSPLLEKPMFHFQIIPASGACPLCPPPAEPRVNEGFNDGSSVCRVVLSNAPGADNPDGGQSGIYSLTRRNPCASSSSDLTVKCRQVFTMRDAAPVPSMCSGAGTCENPSGGCWTYALYGEDGEALIPGWFKTGQSCSPGHSDEYLGPCPSPSCPRREWPATLASNSY
jgi:hypothetical protein